MRHLFRAITLSFFAGVSWAFGPDAFPFACGFVFLAVISHGRQWVLRLLCIALACSAGLLWAGMAMREHAAIQGIYSAGERVELTGTIVRSIEQRQKTQQIVLGGVAVNGAAAPGQVLLWLPHIPALHIFERVQLSCELTYPEPLTEDGRVFRYDFFLAGQRIHVLCSSPRNLVRIGDAGDVRTPLFVAKEAFVSALGRIYPEPEAGLLTGLLLGRASAQETSIRDTFAQVGLSHIVAVSGWNITLVMVLLEQALLSVLPRRRAFPIVLAGVVVYAVLVGGEGSVVRAVLMGGIVAWGRAYGRRADMVNVILCAGLLMVCARPFWLLYDAGFQLSILATLGLVVGSGAVSRVLAFLPDAGEIRDAVSASITAILFTLPISLYVFGTLPVYGLAANILVVPLLPYASIAGALAVLCGILWHPLGMALALPSEGILLFTTRIAEGVGALPYATLHMPALSSWVLVGAYGVPYVLWVFHRRRYV